MLALVDNYFFLKVDHNSKTFYHIRKYKTFQTRLYPTHDGVVLEPGELAALIALKPCLYIGSKFHLSGYKTAQFSRINELVYITKTYRSSFSFPAAVYLDLCNKVSLYAGEKPDTAQKCKICLENSINICLEPCYHCGLCETCAGRILRLRFVIPERVFGPCPFCRERVTKVSKIFFP